MFTIKQLTVGSWRAVCYALTNEEGTIVIDPGAEPDRLERWLGDAEVIGIVLTHCHSDHIGAVNEIVEVTGAWVACGRNDIPGTRDLHLSGFDAEGIDYRVNHVDRALEDGDLIEWGDNTLRVIDTPGHTRGHICLLDEANDRVFSGDMLFAGTIGRTDYPGGDVDAMARSCRRMAQLSPKLDVLPGHGPATVMAREQMTLAHWEAVLSQETARRGGVFS